MIFDIILLFISNMHYSTRR